MVTKRQFLEFIAKEYGILNQRITKEIYDHFITFVDSSSTIDEIIAEGLAFV